MTELKSPGIAATPRFTHLSLARSVQQHESIFGADEQIDAPQSGAQNFRVEALLVFTYFGRVAGGLVRRWRHIDIDMALAARWSRAAGAKTKGQEAALLLLQGVRVRRQQLLRGRGKIIIFVQLEAATG